MEIKYLVRVRAVAGHDDACLKLVKSEFGSDVRVQIINELSDIYILCDQDESVLPKIKRVQSDAACIDTDLEVINVLYLNQGEIETDSVYTIWVSCKNATTDNTVEALKDLAKQYQDGATLISVSEVFSDYADLIVQIAVDFRDPAEVSQMIRALPDVYDTTVYSLRRGDRT